MCLDVASETKLMHNSTICCEYRIFCVKTKTHAPEIMLGALRIACGIEAHGRH